MFVCLTIIFLLTLYIGREEILSMKKNIILPTQVEDSQTFPWVGRYTILSYTIREGILILSLTMREGILILSLTMRESILILSLSVIFIDR